MVWWLRFIRAVAERIKGFWEELHGILFAVKCHGIVGRSLIIASLVLLVVNGAHCALGEDQVGCRVSFVNQTLMVDGKPFFMLATIWGNQSLEPIAERHLNTVFFWTSSYLRSAIDQAKALGLMLVPYIHSPHLYSGKLTMEDVARFVLELENETQILAWNIGDDFGTADVPLAKEVYELVKSIDPQRPVMLDGPMEGNWSFVDMYCTYNYPLLKGNYTPGMPGLRGNEDNLEVYGDYLDRARSSQGQGRYFWTWLQAHTQYWYTHNLLGGPPAAHRPSRFPDPSHIRILTYTAISHGVRGIIYYTYKFFWDDWYGRDRFAEVGVIGAEIEIVGPYLAAGRLSTNLPTDSKDLQVSSFEYDGDVLLVLAMMRPYYSYSIDEGLVENVSIYLPFSAEGISAYSISFPRVTPLKLIPETAASSILIIPRVELTDLVLLTSSPDKILRIENQLLCLLPDAARFAVEALDAQIEKVGQIWSELRRLGINPPGLDDLFRHAEEMHAQSGELISRQRYAEAYEAARAGQRLLRSLTDSCWKLFRPMYHDPQTPAQFRKYLIDYYVLPLFYTTALEGLKEEIQEQNQLLDELVSFGVDVSEERRHLAKLNRTWLEDSNTNLSSLVHEVWGLRYSLERLKAETYVRAAEQAIESAKTLGIDTSRYEIFLSRAKISLQEGLFESAVTLASYPLQLSQQIREPFMAAALVQILVFLMLPLARAEPDHP